MFSRMDFFVNEDRWDEDEFGDSEYEAGVDAWGRVRGGWQVGATLDAGGPDAGVGYAPDFNEIAEQTKAGRFTVKAGCNF